MSHICHILTTFKQRASITRRTTAILKECVSQGFKTSLIIGADNDFTPIDGVETVIIPDLYKHISLKNDLKAYWQCKKILEQLKPDIVHTHQAKAGILGRLAANSLNKKPVILHTVHGPTFPQHYKPLKRKFYQVIEVIAGKITDKFVFIGDELKQEYLDGKVCAENNSIIIKTGKPNNLLNRHVINTQEREKLRKELCEGHTQTFLLTYIARIVPGKQHEQAIEVLKQLREKGFDAHLAFVGKALIEKELKYEQSLRNIVKELNLENYIHFNGFYENIYDVIESSDLVIMTSGYEGFSNIIIESMLLGTPVLAYEVAGLKELFQNQFETFAVSQGNINSFVEKASILLKNWKKSVNYSSEVINKLRYEHKLETMLERKMQLYKTLV